MPVQHLPLLKRNTNFHPLLKGGTTLQPLLKRGITLQLQVDMFYDNLLAGKSGISRIEGFDAETFSTQVGVGHGLIPGVPDIAVVVGMVACFRERGERERGIGPQ